MIDMLNNLCNLALFLVGCCVITIVSAVCSIIKCTKKEMLLTEKLEKIKIDNMINKENI